MLTHFEQAQQWLESGKQVACATVISTFGSSPQPPGAKMYISDRGEMAGSVSAGCVEGTVAQTALGMFTDHQARLLEYGVANSVAAEAGLACGGEIRIYLDLVHAESGFFPTVLQCVRQRQSAVLATIIRGDGFGKKWLVLPEQPAPEDISENLIKTVASAVPRVALKQQPVCLVCSTENSESEVFLDVYVPSPRLIIVGAVHTAIPLVSMAKMVGFYTIVIDARAAFATPERFPHADELIKAYPPEVLAKMSLDESTYLVTLTHDEKFDTPSLVEALKCPIRYIGALGSKPTHQRRIEALRELGISDEEIKRIHAPVGLDLGGRTPEEISLEIIAQIMAVRRGMSG